MQMTYIMFTDGKYIFVHLPNLISASVLPRQIYWRDFINIVSPYRSGSPSVSLFCVGFINGGMYSTLYGTQSLCWSIRLPVLLFCIGITEEILITLGCAMHATLYVTTLIHLSVLLPFLPWHHRGKSNNAKEIQRIRQMVEPFAPIPRMAKAKN